MTKAAIALCSATTIPFDGDAVPEWIHLIPAGEVRTMDGRGPYRVADAPALMAASLPAGQKLVLDENHATDLAAPRGESAPARGWIVELQNRDNGIWGRVEWTGEGRRLMEDKAYRGISPAISHRKDGVITHVLRASLINAPNLIGLASLHQEGHDVMDWKVKLCELLGLASDASDEDIAAALKSKLEGGSETALQSALAPIAKAVGLAETSNAAAVLAGVQAIAGGDSNATIVALQGEVASLATQLNQLTEDGTKRAAIAFVDGAIKAGRVGVKPQRDRYISLHMADAAATEAQIRALPILHGTRLSTEVSGNADPEALDDTDNTVIALMGLDPEAYKKNRDAARKEML